MEVLVIDVGGTHVKILATGQSEKREFASGPKMTAEQMVSGVRSLAKGWSFEAVSMGYPGPVLHDRPVADPKNLGPGWMGFDFKTAFARPTKVLNDAAMQALGSYHGGKTLFLGLGTGLGSALIVDRMLVPMELAHLPYRSGTFEDYVGLRGLVKHGKTKWRAYVEDVVDRLIHALLAEDVVLGGGNAKLLKSLPPACRLGSNADAFVGGFRLWDKTHRHATAARHRKGTAA